MKTNFNIVSKVKSLTLTAALFISSGLFSQEGKIWTRIPSFNEMGITIRNGKVYSTNTEINTLFQSLNITSVNQALPSSHNEDLLQVYEISCNCDENELLQTIAKKSTVFQQPQIGPKYEVLYTPNDYSIAFSSDYAMNLINAQGAWDVTHGDTSIVIAVSDQGFDLNHEELIGKYNYVTPGMNNSSYYHGTAVAIIAAGNTDNNIGKSSIGFNSTLQLRPMSYDEILNATYSGARVINVSWTSGCYYDAYAQQVMDEVYANGSIVIAAAGNGSTCGGPSNLVYPAALNHVISVTSVGPNNNHERYVGDTTSTHQHNVTVDLSAPGYDVALSVQAGWYLTGNGTSFAAPYVSGTVGLMLAANPCLTIDQVEYILKSTADNIDNLNPLYAGKIGTGRLNAAAAVAMARNYTTLNLNANVEVDCINHNQVVSLNVSNGLAPFDVIWSTGDSSMTIAVTNVNDTCVATIRDSRGCYAHYEMIPDSIRPMNFSADVVNLNCYGDANGSIDLNVSGGKPAYSFLWSTGDTTATINNLTAGIYTVNVTDSNGCMIYTDFEVNQPARIDLNFSVVNETAANYGSVYANVTGGTAPYTYFWSNGCTTSNVINLEEGDYTLTVTDNNGCVSGANVVVTYETINNSNSSNANEIGIETAGIENLNSTAIKMYPNPSTDVAIVSWEDMMVTTLSVTDMGGRLVEQATINQSNGNFQVIKPAAGEFIVNLTLSNGSKIVKKVMFL